MAVMATLIGGLVWAQEKAAQLDVDVDMNKGTDMSGNWMQSINLGNWRLVLIILIALVARGGNSK
jgi:hypothetical protein